jgi:hypothetical protein
MNPSYTIQERATGLRVTIPSEKNGGTLVIMLVLLAILGYFASRFARDLNPRGDLVLFLLDLLILGGMLALAVLFAFPILWQLLGSEIIDITAGELRVKRALLGLGTSKKYTLAQVRNLRMEVPYSPKTYGLLAFEYGAQTVHFAGSITPAEAMQLVETIRVRFP